MFGRDVATEARRGFEFGSAWLAMEVFRMDHLERRVKSRKGIIALIAAGALASTAVWAASVHLKGGRNAEPSFTDNGLSLSAAGEIAGLGEGDVVVSVVAEANVIATCTNQGGTQAPGQNPAPITVTGSDAIPEDELKNGNTPFDVQTDPPPSVIAGAPDCPNDNWTEEIEDLEFTSATITVEQPAGNVVLTVECTFTPATSDGPVPAGNVSCTSSS